jgi:hypothetical protein
VLCGGRPVRTSDGGGGIGDDYHNDSALTVLLMDTDYKVASTISSMALIIQRRMLWQIPNYAPTGSYWVVGE